MRIIQTKQFILKLIYLILIFFTQTSNAIVGDYILLDSLPDYITNNTCIIIKDNNEICSGVRINSNKIYSAAHCGPLYGENHEPTFKALCYGDQSKSKVKFEPHESFKANKAKHTNKNGIDLAILRYNETNETNEQKYIELFNFKQIDIYDLNKIHCITGGFGYNNNNKRGELNFSTSGKISLEKKQFGLNTFDYFNKKISEQSPLLVIRTTPMKAKPSDSGGPIFCIQDNKYKLFAIHSGPSLGHIPLLQSYIRAFNSANSHHKSKKKPNMKLKNIFFKPNIIND